MKLCKKCGEVKEFSNFYEEKRWPGTYKNLCKKCWNIQNKINSKKFCKTNHEDYQKQYRDKIKEKYGLGLSTISRFGLKLSLEVYEKSKRKCELCGSENDLTIHHKDGQGRHNEEKGLPVNNEISNLQVLCRSCHGGLHSRLYWDKISSLKTTK